jgi:pyrroloquinoline quinone biosynthesis protein B
MKSFAASNLFALAQNDRPLATLRSMLVKILGSAAGGAFPQWNCACPNCEAVRKGTFSGHSRCQTQVAISSDSLSWYLLGASPDLRSQIEATSELHPRTGLRQSPIVGAVLVNADIDHALGLLLLRELQPLRIHATDSVHRILTSDNSMFAMLQRIPNQVAWTNFRPGIAFSLMDSAGKDSGIRCRALSLGTHFPAYVSTQRQPELKADEASVGLIVESASGKRLAYMPAVPRIDEAIVAEVESSDVLLFDGTFWSDDELIRIQGSGQTANQMGHVPVSESLERLARVRRPRKIYIHINNTNPMLNEAGTEYGQVREASWEIAEDGWQFNL